MLATTPLPKGRCIRVTETAANGWKKVVVDTQRGPLERFVYGGSNYIRPLRRGQRCE